MQHLLLLTRSTLLQPIWNLTISSCLPNKIVRRGYIYSAVNGHRNAVFTAALQSLDGAKPKINPNPNTNLTVILNTNPNTNPIR